MRQFLVILILALRFSAASAATIDTHDVWKRGNDLIDRAQAEKKMDHILNPNICVNPSTNHIEVIYTDDFRSSENAYINISTGIVRIARERLNIRIVDDGKVLGNLRQYTIQVMDRLQLICVVSTMVLE